ncbi:hypothetical protein HPGCJGGD_1293 [Methylobacterium haplocladii]|nr:hypothetical protein HPGCJGGD_1293 [Methylobacterium haplocladii]
MRGLTMSHRVRIYRVSKDGSAISQIQVYDTRT